MPAEGRGRNLGAGGGARAGLCALLLGMGLGGCAARQAGSAPPAMAGIEAPRWVTQGSGAQLEDSTKVFYGVGSVHGIRNPSLARSTADNRARAEIGKVFSTYSASLMQDFASAHSDAPSEQAAASQPPDLAQVEQTIKTFSATTLVGVQIVDHWYHPADGSVYALARLNLQQVIDNAQSMGELSGQLRTYVRDQAEAAFGRLAAQEAQMGGAGATPAR